MDIGHLPPKGPGSDLSTISVYLIYGRNKKFDVMAEMDWTGRQGDVRNGVSEGVQKMSVRGQEEREGLHKHPQSESRAR